MPCVPLLCCCDKKPASDECGVIYCCESAQPTPATPLKGSTPLKISRQPKPSRVDEDDYPSDA